MRRLSFRVEEHAPPLINERRPRHAAFEARPPRREERFNWLLAIGLVGGVACLALLVHYAPTILRGVVWVVVTLAVAAGFV